MDLEKYATFIWEMSNDSDPWNKLNEIISMISWHCGVFLVLCPVIFSPPPPETFYQLPFYTDIVREVGMLY